MIRHFLKGRLLLGLAITFSLAHWSTPDSLAQGAGGSCTLVTNRGPVWMRVYEGTGQGKKGLLIWEGHLEKQERKLIKSQTGLVRWDYKWEENADYHLDVGATCRNDDEVKVPYCMGEVVCSSKGWRA